MSLIDITFGFKIFSNVKQTFTEFCLEDLHLKHLEEDYSKLFINIKLFITIISKRN